MFDKEEGRFIFVEMFKKSKKKIPDKKRINELFKKEINIENELYHGEENYLNQQQREKYNLLEHSNPKS